MGYSFSIPKVAISESVYNLLPAVAFAHLAIRSRARVIWQRFHDTKPEGTFGIFPNALNHVTMGETERADVAEGRGVGRQQFDRCPSLDVPQALAQTQHRQRAT